MRKFEEQVRQFPIALSIGEGVTKLSVENKFFAVLTSNGKKFEVVLVSAKADPILVEKAEEAGEVEFLSGYVVKEIREKDKVESIVIWDIKDDKEFVLDVGGVFIEIGAIPNVEFAKDVVKRNELK